MYSATQNPPRPEATPGGGVDLALLDAAVRTLPESILLVELAPEGPVTRYANDTMQALTEHLLGADSQVRLGDLPALGAPLCALIEAAGSAGDWEREVELATRQRSRPMQVRIRRVAGQSHWRLIELSERHDSVHDAESDSDSDHDDAEPTEALRRAAAAGGLGHWEWDLVGGSAWYDGAAANLLGAHHRDVSATVRALHERLHDDDRAPFLSAIRRHLEQQQPFDIEVRVRESHPERWLRLRGAAGREHSGLPTRMAGTLEDTTRQRRQLEDVRRGQAVLRSTFDALVSGIAVLNERGEIVELNRTWAEWPSASGLMGLRFGFGEHYVSLCRSATDRCASAVEAAAGVERVLLHGDAEFILDYRATDLDGADRALQMRVQPFDTATGRGAIVTHTDCTGVDVAMRALKDNDAFYRMVLNSVPLYISYVNDRGELMFVNRTGEEWLGQPLSAMRGRRLAELTDDEGYAALKPRVQAVLGGRRVDFDTQLVRDGVVSDVAVSYVPHVTAGDVVGFFSVARDVTQHKRMEMELLQAQKMEAMGRLTGGVAHDFNNLLSVIIGNLQLLEREVGADSPLRARIGTALGAANRGGDLTRRLLSFSRRNTVMPKPIDVNAVVQGLEDLLTRTIGTTIQFGVALEAGVWPLCVDVGELENALLNLAINACDAMSEGGTLTLTTRNIPAASPEGACLAALPPGDFVEIAVVDTGCGMPPEVISKAFEPFFTTKEPGKGTGLGLSIVYGFAVRAGGTAVIDSKPGVGTTVRLLFPRHTATELKTEDTALMRHGRVLVVDASETRAGESADLLREGGFEVSVASAIDTALSVVAGPSPPNLVLLGDLPPGELGPVAFADRIRLINPSVQVVPSTASWVRPAPAGIAAPPAATDIVAVVRYALAKESASHV